MKYVQKTHIKKMRKACEETYELMMEKCVRSLRTGMDGAAHTRFLLFLRTFVNYRSCILVKGPAADATDTPQHWGWLCNAVMKMTMMIIIFCPFRSNGSQVEWNWQGKTEVLEEKLVPVPLCPPQIPHGLTRDRTRASAVGGRRLTAWAMARPQVMHTRGSWF
jgi:hypothetical protein